MSFEITTAFVQQYSGNVMFLVQQKGSRLRNTVRNMSVTGKNAYFDQIGATAAQRVTTRHADSPLMSTPHARRRVSLLDYDWGDLVDDLDMVRTLIDPTNSYAQNAAWAMGRAMDDEIISAFHGTAYTGEEGGTAVTFPTAATHTIPVDDHTYDSGSGDVGLTISKLTLARELMDSKEVDPEEQRYMGVTAKQLSDLLTTTEVTSADYNTVKALVRGEVDSFMGFMFMRTERFLTASGDRQCPAWVPSGMGLAIGKDVTARISERSDKRYSTYVYYCMAIGTTRIEEARVLNVICNE